MIAAMQAPGVQYVTTSDGYDIAYTVSGEGFPFVFMPWPFNNVSQIWDTRFGRPMLSALARRFRLIQYDSRGQGMSTRGMPEYHALEHYALDLEAVVDKLGLDRFVLYGAPLFNHVAARYAADHPERVAVLVLGDTAVDNAWGASEFEHMVRHDWELFLHMLSSAFSIHGAPVETPYWRGALDRDDCLAMLRAVRGSSLRDVLARIQAPTLLLNTRRLRPDAPDTRLADEGRRLTATIPNARLVLFDGFASCWYSEGAQPPAAVETIARFVEDLSLEDRRCQTRASGAASTAPLSERELEVLRLVARGKTNRQIAEELVISERTVINHLSHILIKTGAENRAAATAYALRHGLI